jgi:hypothetical protein
MGRGSSYSGRALRDLLAGRNPTLSSSALRLSALVAGAVLAASVSSDGTAQPSAAAAPAVAWLDQNWSAEQRDRYHHESQGTLTLPLPSSWLLALEQPANSTPGGLFTDPAYLDNFGFIASPRGPRNPDGLPIGFARTTGFDPRDGRAFDRVGFTCAACHTARIDYQGTSLLIDGGPAMISLADFGKAMAVSLAQTISPIRNDRFRRFADRVLGPGNDARQRLRLRGEVADVVASQLIQTLLGYRSGGVEEGFGRLDALNRIGNRVFAQDMEIERNYVPLTAPVAFPHIWDTHWFSWVQYNGSIEQPMVRNAGEAMGVGAVTNFDDHPTPRFTSTIPVGTLYRWIEQPLRGETQPTAARQFTGLTSPRWPEQVLGRFDSERAAAGAALYRQRCQGCHLPAPNTDEFWTGNHWLAPNSAGERYLDLNMVNIERDPAQPGRRWVGTDPAQAGGMAARTVRAPLALGIPQEYLVGRSGRFGVYPYGRALGEVVAMTVARGYDAANVPEADRPRMNGFRPNGIQAPMQYKARPLNGIWATGPFLHNGSVRTLWELLSPFAERRPFSLGTRQFDPVRVGYVDGGPFALDTSRPGNLNVGHLFDTANAQNRGRGIIGAPLSEDERWAIVEYLKTL